MLGIVLVLLIINHVVADMGSDAEFCVTYSEGIFCGNSSAINLTRIDGIQVGNTQVIDLDDEDRSISMKTINLKPLILEIDDFLLEEECDYLKNEAMNRGLEDSITIQTSRSNRILLRDRNGDKKLSIDEMRWTIQYTYDTYLENSDIVQMLNETGWDINQDGYLTPDETTFSPEELDASVRKILEKQPEKHSRLSKQVWLYHGTTDDTFTKIQKRIAKVTSLPLELIQIGDFQVVSYGVNGHYNAHMDSSIVSQLPCCTRDRRDGCRVCRYMTIMFYLNDVEEGGETAFPVANNDTLELTTVLENDIFNLYKSCADSPLHVQPQKSKAVIWYNHFIDDNTGWMGETDKFTFHGGCPVKQGAKWIANLWVKTTDSKTDDLIMMQIFHSSDSQKLDFSIKEEL